jgi:hypothetical protein
MGPAARAPRAGRAAAPSAGWVALTKALRRRRIVGLLPRLLEVARQKQILFLVHEPTKTPLEILLGSLPFELVVRRALGRSP